MGRERVGSGGTGRGAGGTPTAERGSRLGGLRSGVLGLVTGRFRGLNLPQKTVLAMLVASTVYMVTVHTGQFLALFNPARTNRTHRG